MIEDLGMECFGYSSGYSQDYFLDKIYSIYSKEQEQGDGVLGIRIKLIEQSY
jgi:ASC-1-like (ASCH) protein